MKNNNRIMDAIMLVFFAVFAMPFLGGYFMLDKNGETKVLGGILCVVGLVIWFLFGLH